MADVLVGAVVLEYANRLTAISQLVETASLTAHQMADSFTGEEGFYDGEARVELKQFYESYAANLDKLAYLESVASQYLGKVFEQFGFTDEELTALLQQMVDEGGGS